jgi:hypothetical protein
MVKQKGRRILRGRIFVSTNWVENPGKNWYDEPAFWVAAGSEGSAYKSSLGKPIPTPDFIKWIAKFELKWRK